MPRRYSNRQQYVILPGHGVSGAAMQSPIFKTRTAAALTDALESQVTLVSAAVPSALESAPAAGSELAEAIGPGAFEVISQRFDDGPALVSMTHAARLAIEAVHPGLRVFPVTRYHLPGRKPRRAAKGATAAAARPSAESAVGSDGAVFAEDLRHHVLAGIADAGAKGANVIVGVVDTGIDATHPALQGQVSALRCLIPGADPAAGGPVDWGAAHAVSAGHGTHVAGIIAAAAGFGGPAGVAPNAKLISYRIFADDPRRETGASNLAIIYAIRAAIHDGCHVVNLSIEGTPREDGLRSAIEEAWANGVLCIAAAGNGGGNPVSFPAALQHCVAVTAIGRDGAFPDKPAFKKFASKQRASTDNAIFLASFSNYGPQVQFTAPGHAIVSTFPGNQWWFDSGTSMAAPFISGLLARLLSDNGNILAMPGTAERSAAMLQMLVGRARVLGLPQAAQEGYGLPL